MINDNVSLELILLLRVCMELQILSKTACPLCFTLTKSTRTVTLQDVSLLNLKSGGPNATTKVTILVREYSKNHQKITTSNVIFSRTTDRIAGKFCMRI